MKFGRGEIRLQKLDDEGRPTGEEATVLGHITMAEAADVVHAPGVEIETDGRGIYVAPETREITVEWTLTDPAKVFDLRVALGHGAYRLTGKDLGFRGVEDVWGCDCVPLPPSYERLNLFWGERISAADMGLGAVLDTSQWGISTPASGWTIETGLGIRVNRWLPTWVDSLAYLHGMRWYRASGVAAIETRETQLRRDYRTAALGWAEEVLARDGHVMDVEAVVEGMLRATEFARSLILDVFGIEE